MGKGFTFFLFGFLIVCLAGGIMQSSVQFASTELTADIDDDDNDIPVVSTEGFPSPGIIIIDDERIAYSRVTDTSFTQTFVVGNITNPVVRGVDDTVASAHSEGARVRTVEGSLMNTSVTYNVSVIANPEGLWAAGAIPIALVKLIGSFLLLPLSFLGTDLSIIAYFWYAMAAGLLVSLAVALAGGRRV